MDNSSGQWKPSCQGCDELNRRSKLRTPESPIVNKFCLCPQSQHKFIDFSESVSQSVSSFIFRHEFNWHRDVIMKQDLSLCSINFPLLLSLDSNFSNVIDGNLIYFKYSTMRGFVMNLKQFVKLSLHGLARRKSISWISRMIS